MTAVTDLPDSVTLTDSVLTIAVSSPAAGTSLDIGALKAVTPTLHAVARGEVEVAAILLVGTGPNFCAGGNVRAFAAAAHRPAYLRETADALHRFLVALTDAHRPIVAAVKGWAAGAGMSLVLYADIAIGGTSTNLRPAYPAIGLTPDGGMTWNLPRIVGAARAREIILTNQVITGPEAVALGILSRLVDDADVETQARAAAAAFTTGPRAALAAARDLLDRSPSSSLIEQLAAESASIAAHSGTPEGIEGVDAFLAKRTPDFAAARER
ncbi:MAG: enoyl-CoA hydratase-related protein [Gordonia sp. (in: high G+C Gram-positive bacteria)]